MRFVLLLPFICLSFSSWSQENNASNSKVAEALKVSFESQDPQTSLLVLNQVTQLVDDTSDTLKIQYYLALGTAYGQMGKSDSALFFLDKSDALSASSPEKRWLVKSLNAKGNVYMMLGEYENSLAEFQKALKAVELMDQDKIGDQKERIIGNMAGIFFQIEDYEAAKNYLNDILKDATVETPVSTYAFTYLRMGLVYQAMQQPYDVIINYLDSATSYFLQMNDTTMLIYNSMLIGDIYKDEGNAYKALEAYQKGYDLSLLIKDQETIINSHLSMADIYLKRDQWTAAEQKAKTGLEIARINDFPYYQKRAYDILHSIASAKGNFKAALEFKNKYYAISDSLSSADVKERVAELQTKYETEKKELEIESLILENNLKEANLEKAENELIGFIIVGLLTLSLLAVYYTQRNKKLRAEKIQQEFQLDALRKRIVEIQSGGAVYDDLELDTINEKMNTPLTERELEALKLIMKGKANKEIADALFVSINTVKFHLTNIYQKLGVTNKKEALEYVVKTS